MASLPLLKDEGLTYGDYRRWTDGGRWELIDGITHDMSPAPSTEHQRISMALASTIHALLTDRDCEVFAAPFDVRLPRADEADDEIRDVVQPDISVVCDREKLDPRGCRGAPDWIIEILSPSTAAKDHIEKLALYERSGVGEYWLVHPDYRIVTVYCLGPDRRYGRPGIHSATDRVQSATLPDLTIHLETIFGEGGQP